MKKEEPPKKRTKQDKKSPNKTIEDFFKKGATKEDTAEKHDEKEIKPGNASGYVRDDGNVTRNAKAWGVCQ